MPLFNTINSLNKYKKRIIRRGRILNNKNKKRGIRREI
jgi:hypothetical protein